MQQQDGEQQALLTTLDGENLHRVITIAVGLPVKR